MLRPMRRRFQPGLDALLSPSATPTDRDEWSIHVEEEQGTSGTSGHRRTIAIPAFTASPIK